MKENEDKVFDLLEDININTPMLTEDELKRIYDMEIEKLNVKVKPTNNRFSNKKMKIFLIAAVLTLVTATVFAATIKITDIFKGIFKEQNEIGEIVDIDKNSYIIEEAGAVINEMVNLNGLDISINGVIGDNDTIFLMVDVINKLGEPLKSLYNKSSQIGQLKFKSAFLSIETGQEGIGGQYCNTQPIVVDNDKASFLIKEKSIYENIIGKKATLVLTDLIEYVNPNPTEIDMTYDNLYEIYTKLDKNSNFDGDQNGLIKRKDQNSIIDESNDQLVLGNERLKFSNKYKDLTMSNMAFKDSIFYMNMVELSKNGYDQYQSLAFQNIKTKETIYFTGSTLKSNIDDNGQILQSEIYVKCDQIKSEEDLKDYILITNAEHHFEPVVNGEWTFEFNLDYKNTSNIYNVNSEITLNNEKLKCEKITISPISINLEVKSNSYENDMSGVIGLSDIPIKIIMENNILENVNYGSYNYDVDTNVGSIRCILPVVIDPTKVKSVQFGNTIINLK